jgi:aminoglycoside 6'-N-acetyltransferase I
MTDIIAWGPELLGPAVELYIDVFNAEPWNDRWTVATATPRLAGLQATPGFEGAALTGGGELLAFLAGHRQPWWDGGDHFYLAEFAVARHARRRGHGTRLLTGFLAGLHGVTSCHLLTAVDGEAGAFYRRSGFRPARRQGVMIRSL